MKSFYINFFSIIIFTVIIGILNFKHSGGDIFVQFMILCFALLALVVSGVFRCIIKFDFFRCFIGIIAGTIVSYIIFFILNYIAIKH